MAVTGTQSTSLRALVRTISQHLAEGNYPVTDMSRATSLELDPTLSLGSIGGDRVAGEIRRLEGPVIEARRVERSGEPSPIRYFLDGSQKTLPVWRVGTIPVIASVSAAAVLKRMSPQDISLCEETLVTRLHWIVPRYTRNATLNRIVDLLEEMGESVTDPFEDEHEEDPEGYQRFVSGYTHCLEKAYNTASSLRARTELDLLRQWERFISPGDREGWIVIDGLLDADIPNAIGLVKNAHVQHLHGSEAVALYDLPVGHRTSAYALVDSGNREQWNRAMWYLRMQNAVGQDARHGLIRLEAPAILADIELVDQISSWILAERAPRASSDSRWATLLYPIHLLERMLKRRIQAVTAGWPA